MNYAQRSGGVIASDLTGARQSRTSDARLLRRLTPRNDNLDMLVNSLRRKGAQHEICRSNGGY